MQVKDRKNGQNGQSLPGLAGGFVPTKERITKTKVTGSMTQKEVMRLTLGQVALMLTAGEVGRIVNRSRTTIHQWRQDTDVPHIRVNLYDGPPLIRFPTKQFYEWCEANGITTYFTAREIMEQRIVADRASMDRQLRGIRDPELEEE